MRILLAVPLLLPFAAFAANNAASLWTELAATRGQSAGYHQEFDGKVAVTSSTGKKQSSTRKATLDGMGNQWRFSIGSGVNLRTTLYDGASALIFAEGGTEFVKAGLGKREDAPMLPAYRTDIHIAKAVEVARGKCGLAGADKCVLLEAPFREWMRSGASGVTRMTEGKVRVAFDLATGLALTMSVSELIEGPRSARRIDSNYTTTALSLKPAPADRFAPPVGMTEVKQFTTYDGATIRRLYGGKAAPELEVADLSGGKIRLADYRGKMVLLDFWTTWCGPCRADGPVIEKLHQKYGDKDLRVIGVSVDEERQTVEEFLSANRRSYPIVLTSENEMPNPYRIHAFPTYMVIDREGKLETVIEGDRGAGLEKVLRKYGLETE